MTTRKPPMLEATPPLTPDERRRIRNLTLAFALFVSGIVILLTLWCCHQLDIATTEWNQRHGGPHEQR